jgi:uncharacterized membrane protein YdbT with pleckstrin-like domain
MMLLTFPDGTQFNPAFVAAIPPIRYDWQEKRWTLQVVLAGGYILKARSEETVDTVAVDAEMVLLRDRILKAIAE